MRSNFVIHTIETHTEGMPTRVVTGGFPPIPGETMAAKRQWAMEHRNDLRLLLTREPHGHSAMTGAILQPATRDDAHWGVLYIEPTGFLPMCGHGTIGVVTALIETGMVPITEPVTAVRLDTPAGLVTADAEVADDQVVNVTLTNVPAFVLARDETVEVPGHGTVTYDMVYGGNFYPIVQAADVGLDIELGQQDRIVAFGLQVIAAINTQKPPVHPGDPLIRGIHHAQFVQPGTDGADARNIVMNHPGYFDRSPCGTGTSARLAALHARGEIGVGEEFVNESILGSRFTGRIVTTTTEAGHDAIIPSFTGRAWITGTAQHMLDPTDPFPAGFTL